MTAPRRHRSHRRAVRAAVAGVSLLAFGTFGGGTTMGRWSSHAAFRGGTVTAGDLLVTTGPMTWRQVTPGVANPASGDLATTPDDFVSMPGDVVEIRVPVTTVLQGDNLVADLVADYAAPESAAGVVTSVVVENDGGQQVASTGAVAAGGASLAVPGLVGDDDGTPQHWTVVLRVELLGDYRWTTPQTGGAGADWSAGSVRVAAGQVRAAGELP